MDDNDLKLKDNPVIADFQDYVQKMKEQRGLNLSDPKLDCMMLAEECGELISTIRKHMEGGSIGSGSHIGDIKLEMADVFIILLGMANMHGVDLEKAFREKEEINKQRIWKRI